MAKPKTKWKPKKVNGRVQRARTYQPGYDVICVRAPSLAIDHIRNLAKRLDVSISSLVTDAVAKYKRPVAKKKAKTKRPAVANHVASVPKPEARAEA